MEIHTRVRYLEKLNARDTAIFLTAQDKSRLAYVGNAIFMHGNCTAGWSILIVFK